MGGKPRNKPADREFSAKNFDKENLSEGDLKEICSEMAGILVWMLKYAKMPDGIMFNMETMASTGNITEKTFETLDAIGHVIDREKYYADRKRR